MTAVKTKTPDIFTTFQKYPVRFLNMCYGAELWEKQQEIVLSVRDNRYTTVASCHASGKSFTAAHIVHWFLHAFPHSIVLTTAPTFRQVQDVLWKEINTAYGKGAQRFDISGDMLKVRYNLSSDWFAVGLSTDDPDKFQGYHAKSILIIIDESSGVPSPIFDAIEGVASTGNVHILHLGNPTDPTGYFANTFKSQFFNKIHISCFDTPNFIPFRGATEAHSIQLLEKSTPEQREKAATQGYLITPEWVYQRLIEWGPDSSMFMARCLGHFPLEGDDTLIPMRHALECVTHQQPVLMASPPDSLGVDVARYGTDKTVLCHIQGGNVVSMQAYPRTATTEVAGMIAQWYQAHPFGTIRIDDSGVGGGVVDICQENKIPVIPVNVGESPYGATPQQLEEVKRMFINKRGQYYWQLAQRIRKHEIGIPDIDTLLSELTSTKYKLDSKGHILIETKDDMKARGLHSPDYADALMLAAFQLPMGSWGDTNDEVDRNAAAPPPLTAGFRTKKF